jgi:erythromycin esterase-like protein
MPSRRPHLCAVLLFVTGSCAAADQGDRARPPATASELDLVVRDLCDRKIVLLGEDAGHGAGTTLAFKTRLVKRLVDECHFDGFVIEAGTYDFIDLEARGSGGTPVDHAALAAAIGGVWANQEVAELIPFLAERTTRGALSLGGMDDQIGRGTYAQQRMSGELLAFLDDERRAVCQATIDRDMRWEYDDAHPHTDDAVKAILGCWRDVGAALARPAGGRSTPRLAGYRTMAAALERVYERELAGFVRGAGESDATRWARDFNARDRSMFANFERWVGSHPHVKKIIVWTATVHAAKTGAGEEIVPFGAHVFAKYGAAAFVLGFSAQTGRVFIHGRGAVDLEPAGQETVEARALAPPAGATRYVRQEQLAAFGAIAARAISYQQFTVAAWNTVLDGLVVFLEEVAPGPPR